MLNSIIDMPSMAIMEKAMQAASLRHEVLSNNMANVNTPGFKRKRVEFEKLLSAALYGADNSKKLRLARTNPRDIAVYSQGGNYASVQPVVQQINDTTMRADGNNVDPDREMAGMAKNTMYYDALAREMGAQISNLRLVIKGQ